MSSWWWSSSGWGRGGWGLRRYGLDNASSHCVWSWVVVMSKFKGIVHWQTVVIVLPFMTCIRQNTREVCNVTLNKFSVHYPPGSWSRLYSFQKWSQNYSKKLVQLWKWLLVEFLNLDPCPNDMTFTVQSQLSNDTHVTRSATVTAFDN